MAWLEFINNIEIVGIFCCMIFVRFFFKYFFLNLNKTGNVLFWMPLGLYGYIYVNILFYFLVFNKLYINISTNYCSIYHPWIIHYCMVQLNCKVGSTFIYFDFPLNILNISIKIINIHFLIFPYFFINTSVIKFRASMIIIAMTFKLTIT